MAKYFVDVVQVSPRTGLSISVCSPLPLPRTRSRVQASKMICLLAHPVAATPYAHRDPQSSSLL